MKFRPNGSCKTCGTKSGQRRASNAGSDLCTAANDRVGRGDVPNRSARARSVSGRLSGLHADHQLNLIGDCSLKLDVLTWAIVAAADLVHMIGS